MNKISNPLCNSCGAAMDEVSQRTNQKVTTIYECNKCGSNYCDQCNESKKSTLDVQLCLGCDSVIEKV